ncbi:acylphosphatase-2 isoform X2 [Cygnus atratus]|uniref:acylphosphatase-2 isoform X2 n=1 Tax=Cygnus atratus TaxID=8868 RepID=UPI0015D6455B|nr:acylphosphatase-2 isoform X2 [Cygnus atratus]
MEEAPFNLNKFEGSGTNENYADTYCVYIKNKKVQKTGLYTEEEARKLGVVGWVKNTSQGTVTGQVQGPEDKVNAMKSWLTKVGSPSSRIDRTNFSNEKEISKLDFSGFSTRY